MPPIWTARLSIIYIHSLDILNALPPKKYSAIALTTQRAQEQWKISGLLSFPEALLLVQEPMHNIGWEIITETGRTCNGQFLEQ